MIWITIPASLYLAVQLLMWWLLPGYRSRTRAAVILVLIVVLLAGVYDMGFRK